MKEYYYRQYFTEYCREIYIREALKIENNKNQNIQKISSQNFKPTKSNFSDIVKLFQWESMINETKKQIGNISTIKTKD